MHKERQEFLEAARRTQADFENFRKQAQKRQDEAVQRALGRLIEGLLPVLDACDAAVAHGEGEAVEPVVKALYGALEKEGLERIDPAGEPSPGRLAELTGQVRRTGVTTVFTETLVSPKVAQTLAREAGVRTATLDPVEGLAEGSGDDYLSLMRKNLQTLRTALECP